MCQRIKHHLILKIAYDIVPRMDLTAAQVRAARALLGWSQQQLADASFVGVATIRRFEPGSSIAMGKLQNQALKQALEAAGVIFIEQNGGGPGVRLR